MNEVVLDFIERNRKQVNEFEKTCIDTVIKIADTIVESIKQGGCVYLCGNTNLCQSVAKNLCVLC